MIGTKEKCHSLAFHLQKDLIILARFRLFLEAENISSYVPGFLAVLQLLTRLRCCIPRSQYS